MTKKYNYTMKTGRPSKYDPSFVEALFDYLETTGKEQTELPTIEGFAIFLHVHRDTLYEWAKLHKDFSDTLKNLEQIQKNQLINDGIYGGKEVNATIVKLLLQNNHGMREKSDTDITSGGKAIQAPILGGITKDDGIQSDDSDKETI